MKSIFFLIIALFGLNAMVEARAMSDKEAQDRAQIVTMGGD